ncbi:PAS domain S-box protein [Nodularia sp. NIES-3585]|uniref:PAS domain S-box protein n=1 Tax=Nodularia sp. NIES-3585 TaxID=1973477 RepID=UPI000B5C2E10|nr:PAS domain S-box protein [Nodularia sp. NIES-3585]GAX37776.1 multi-sensor hybrid histidine kinase [Nodularia sp. NIES-3585]
MKFSIENKIRSVFGLTMLILSIVGGFSFWSAVQLSQKVTSTADSQKVAEQLKDLSLQIEAADNGIADYVITGKKQYLQPYLFVVDNIPRQLEALHQKSKNNHPSLQQLTTLETLINKQLAVSKEIIAVRELQGFVSAQKIMSLDGSQKQKSAIQNMIKEMQHQENQQLKQYLLAVGANSQTTKNVVFISSVLAIALIPSGIFIIHRDIAYMKRIKAALRESEERFRCAYNNAAIGMALVAPNGRWLSVNSALCDIVGYPEAELLNITFQAITHPEDLDTDLNYVQRLLAGEIRSYQMEKRYFHKQGYIVWVLLSVSLMRETPTKSPYLIAQIQDITKQKLAQESLRESERRFHAIFNQTFQFIGLLKPDGTLLEANETALNFAGIKSADIVNRPFWEARWWTISAATQAQLQKAIASASAGEFVRYEVEVLGAGDTITTIDLSLKPVFDETGNVVLIIPEGRDISRRKQAEEEMRKAKEAAELANQAKSMFLANMSHELRTPLNAILGFTQVMKRDRSLTPKQQEYLQIISRSCDHLLGLINDVLDLAKIESGYITHDDQRFNLHLLLQCVFQMLKPKAEAKKLQFNFYGDPNLPKYAIADEKKIRQILINLLSNAIKFTENGSVILRVQPSNKEPQTNQILWLSFEVEDTGVGIAATDIKTIFHPFFQTQSGKNITEGTGLGLSISNKLIQFMGGKITVNSSLGQGSKFTFDIPVGLADTDLVLSPNCYDQVNKLAPGQPSYRVLIVDDQAENRLLLVELLTHLGLEVREATNGQEALTIWKQWEPQLILMDIRMPVMDGYAATKQIRATPKGAETIIIALTAYSSTSDRTLAINAGCDDFVTKPFSAEILYAKIRGYLGLRYE